MFSQINIVPRWIIFTLDLTICFVSLTIAYLIKHNFDLSNLDYVEFSRNVLVTAVISTLVFLNVRTYSGIIRYTSAQDTFRILYAVFVSNSTFFLLNMIFVATGRSQMISNSILIINGLASFPMLITYRVLVKYFFIYIKNLKLDTIRVMIYGAGEAGVATKRTFDHDPHVNKYSSFCGR